MLKSKLDTPVVNTTLNINQKFADQMYRTLYKDEMKVNDRSRSVGIFCVGFHNWLNGKAEALFIGEYSQCKDIVSKQKRYIEKMLGFVPQLEGETYVTFGISKISDTILSLSMALLPDEKATQYRSIKAQQIKTGNLGFTGIIDNEIGQTEVLRPINPDTGSLPDFSNLTNDTNKE